MRKLIIIIMAFIALVGCLKPDENETRMIKLYRTTGDISEYWETWNDKDVHIIHWGELGKKGNTKELRDTLFSSASKKVNAEIEKRKTEGYREIPIEKHDILIVEYKIQGMGTTEDLEKRHRLQSRMDETLGWTGLGHCDGGSIGSGTMEVCLMVVNYQLAMQVIQKDLIGTEFLDYSRIYKENK